MAYKITAKQKREVLAQMRSLPRDRFDNLGEMATHIHMGGVGYNPRHNYDILMALRERHAGTIKKALTGKGKRVFETYLRRLRNIQGNSENLALKAGIEALPGKESFRSWPKIARAAKIDRDRVGWLLVLYPRLKRLFPNLSETSEGIDIWKARRPAFEYVGRTMGDKLRTAREIRDAVNKRLVEVHGKDANRYKMGKPEFVRTRFVLHPEVEALFTGWLKATVSRRDKSAKRVKVLRELGLERGTDFTRRAQVLHAANERLGEYAFPMNTHVNELGTYLPGKARGLFPLVDALWKGNGPSSRIGAWRKAFPAPPKEWSPPKTNGIAPRATAEIKSIEKGIGVMNSVKSAMLDERVKLARLALANVKRRPENGPEVATLEGYLEWAERSKRYWDMARKVNSFIKRNRTRK